MSRRQYLKIWGPPGTGKTRRLIEVCQKEMAGGRSAWEIVFCSFTRAAAGEARSRAVDRFGGTIEDYPWFSTEHSICFRLLGLNRSQVLTRRKLREFGRLHNYEYSNGKGDENLSLEERYNEAMLQTLGDYYEAFISYMRNRMLPFDTAYREFLRQQSDASPDGFTRSGLELYIERREKWKRENSLWAFEDMIAGALERDLCPPGTTVLIADECQDSSPLLYELLKRWAGRMESYYLAGDPLQAIYKFSGASPELFFDFPGEQEILSHSYRLPPEIKNLAQGIIARTGLPFPEYSAADRPGVVERTQFAAIDWADAGDCFLLARTRWLLSLYAGQLRDMGVPFKTERGHHSPLTNSRGRAFYTLVRLHDGERVCSSELANLTRHTGAPWLKRGAKTRGANLVEGTYGERDLSYMGFSDEFMRSAGQGDFGAVLCKDFDPDDRAYLFRVLKTAGRAAFEEEPKVVLTTIHGSKGREKPVVYLCPDMTRRVWDGFARDKESESLVFYVGATRAIDKLVVLAPEQYYSFPLPR